MNRLVCSHVPYMKLHEHLDVIIERKWNPEIQFSSEALDRIVWEELDAVAEALHGAGLETTIHGPFLDLNPAATDALAKELVLKRFRQTFKAAGILKPRVIVLHPGYDKYRYLDSSELWLRQSLLFWREILPLAQEAGCVVAIENIFEEEPATLKALLETLNSPYIGHCFDIGHFNLFAAVTIDEWFRELGEYIVESHIHDNFGRSDDHLPPGEGNIDFAAFFPLLTEYAPNAVWTLEAHSIERLERAHGALRRLSGIERNC